MKDARQAFVVVKGLCQIVHCVVAAIWHDAVVISHTDVANGYTEFGSEESVAVSIVRPGHCWFPRSWLASHRTSVPWRCLSVNDPSYRLVTDFVSSITIYPGFRASSSRFEKGLHPLIYILYFLCSQNWRHPIRKPSVLLGLTPIEITFVLLAFRSTREKNGAITIVSFIVGYPQVVKKKGSRHLCIRRNGQR